MLRSLFRFRLYFHDRRLDNLRFRLFLYDRFRDNLRFRLFLYDRFRDNFRFRFCCRLFFNHNWFRLDDRSIFHDRCRLCYRFWCSFRLRCRRRYFQFHYFSSAKGTEFCTFYYSVATFYTKFLLHRIPSCVPATFASFLLYISSWIS